MMKAKHVGVIVAMLGLSACAHFVASSMVRGRPAGTQGELSTRVAVIATSEATSDMVVMGMAGQRGFEVWYDENNDGVLDQQNPMCSTCTWPNSRTPSVMVGDPENRELYVSISGSATNAYDIYRRAFNTSGVPTSGWSRICTNLPTGVFEIAGDKLYEFRQTTSSTYQLRVRNLSDCSIASSDYLITLPAGRTQFDGTALSFDSVTHKIIAAVQLNPTGSRELFLTVFGTDANGGIVEATRRTQLLPTHEGFTAMHANEGFLTVISKNGTAGFYNLPQYDVDLYFESTSYRLQDSYTTEGASLGRSSIDSGRKFTGGPCPSGRSGRWMWTGRNSYSSLDDRLLERRAVCADW